MLNSAVISYKELAPKRVEPRLQEIYRKFAGKLTEYERELKENFSLKAEFDPDEVRRKLEISKERFERKQKLEAEVAKEIERVYNNNDLAGVEEEEQEEQKGQDDLLPKNAQVRQSKARSQGDEMDIADKGFDTESDFASVEIMEADQALPGTPPHLGGAIELSSDDSMSLIDSDMSRDDSLADAAGSGHDSFAEDDMHLDADQAMAPKDDPDVVGSGDVVVDDLVTNPTMVRGS